MPSETTLKQYAMRMEKLRRQNVAYTDLNALMRWFDLSGQGPSSQKVYLSAIKHSDPDAFPKALQDKLNELYTEQNKRDVRQVLTEAQQEKFMKWDDIMKAYKSFEPSNDTRWKEYVVMSLYLLQAPVRADYGEMQVFPKYDKKRTGNELIWNKNPVFVFRDYKTAKTYGEVKIPVSKPLQNVIRGWFNHLDGTPTYLLGNEISPNTFAVYVARTFKKLVGRELGVSMLRHAYITHMFPKLKSIKQKQLLAKKMLHSRDLQEKYISLKDME